jgi:hypothetical protein
MSEITLYAILFFAFFPALCLLAWWLDHIWPSTSELLKKRGESPKDPVPVEK